MRRAFPEISARTPTGAAVAFVLLALIGCGSDVAPAVAVPTPPSTPALGASASATPGDASVSAAPTAPSDPAEAVDPDRYPVVVAVVAEAAGTDTWRFDVTLSSPYDTPERYADAWRVLDADNTELGTRVLIHDHATEQPFTRSATITIPSDLTTVFVEGRDQVNGWSGQRFVVTLTR